MVNFGERLGKDALSTKMSRSEFGEDSSEVSYFENYFFRAEVSLINFREYKQQYNPGSTFILGHSVMGVLGSSRLGAVDYGSTCFAEHKLFEDKTITWLDLNVGSYADISNTNISLGSFDNPLYNFSTDPGDIVIDQNTVVVNNGSIFNGLHTDDYLILGSFDYIHPVGSSSNSEIITLVTEIQIEDTIIGSSEYSIIGSDGCINYYNCDVSGSLIDSVEGHNGNPINASNLDTVPGIIGSCFSGDEPDHYSFDTGFSGSVRTITFWGKSEVDITTTVSVSPMGSTSTGDGILFGGFTTDFGGEKIGMIFGNDPKIGWSTIDNISSDIWVHYAFVWSEGDSKWRLYLDGVDEGLNDLQTALKTPVPFGVGSIFDIGRYNAGFGWNGSLDEISYWTKSLTGNEIGSLHGSGSGLTYPFTGSVATTGVLNIYKEENDAGSKYELNIDNTIVSGSLITNGSTFIFPGSMSLESGSWYQISNKLQREHPSQTDSVRLIYETEINNNLDSLGSTSGGDSLINVDLTFDDTFVGSVSNGSIFFKYFGKYNDNLGSVKINLIGSNTVGSLNTVDFNTKKDTYAFGSGLICEYVPNSSLIIGSTVKTNVNNIQAHAIGVTFGSDINGFYHSNNGTEEKGIYFHKYPTFKEIDSDFTFEIKIKENDSASGDIGVLISNSTGDAAGAFPYGANQKRSYYIYRNASNNLVVQSSENGINVIGRTTSNLTFDFGSPMVLSLVKDVGSVFVYKNGSLTDTLVGFNDNLYVGYDLPVNIGMSNKGQFTMNGSIFYFRAWNRALDSTEVGNYWNQNNVSSFPSDTNKLRMNNIGSDNITLQSGSDVDDNLLFGYWKLDEGTGTSFSDTSINSNDAIGSVVTFSTNHIGSYVILNGSTSAIRINDSTTFDTYKLNTFNLTFIPSETYGLTNGSIIPLVSFGGASDDAMYSIGIKNGSVYSVVGSLSGSVLFTTPDNELTSGSIYNLAVTNDGENTRAYLNGSLLGSSVKGYDMEQISGSISIGTWKEDSGSVFNGGIQQVRFYPYHQGQTEIQSLWNSGSPTGSKFYWVTPNIDRVTTNTTFAESSVSGSVTNDGTSFFSFFNNIEKSLTTTTGNNVGLKFDGNNGQIYSTNIKYKQDDI